MKIFDHSALKLHKNMPLIYTAMSKQNFYYRMHISKFVIEKGAVPLNPFMIFDYFLLDSIDRNKIRESNNNLVKRADAVWIFGSISDGVLAEIKIAKSINKPLKYYKLTKSKNLVEIEACESEMEDNVKQFKNMLL